MEIAMIKVIEISLNERDLANAIAPFIDKLSFKEECKVKYPDKLQYFVNEKIKELKIDESQIVGISLDREITDSWLDSNGCFKCDETLRLWIFLKV